MRTLNTSGGVFLVYKGDEAEIPWQHVGTRWYFRPRDWEGDIWSRSYKTEDAAVAAAREDGEAIVEKVVLSEDETAEQRMATFRAAWDRIVALEDQHREESESGNPLIDDAELARKAEQIATRKTHIRACIHELEGIMAARAKARADAAGGADAVEDPTIARAGISDDELRKRRRGRPRLPADKRRTHRLEVRVTQDEAKYYEHAARIGRRASVSDWARFVLAREAVDARVKRAERLQASATNVIDRDRPSIAPTSPRSGASSGHAAPASAAKPSSGAKAASAAKAAGSSAESSSEPSAVAESPAASPVSAVSAKSGT